MCFKWFKPKPPIPPVEYVTVEICTETQKLKNLYCIDTMPKKYVKGTEPTVLCQLHAEAPYVPKKVKNPLHESGILNCWVGLLYSDLTYLGFIEAQLNSYYDALAEDKTNVLRAFGWWTDMVSGPWFGKYLLPWSVNWTWSESYWSMVISRIKNWSDRGGWYIVDILDACSLYEGETWETNPLKNIASSPTECFYDTPARAKIIEYAKELVSRTQGLKVIFGTRNEGGQIVGVDGLRDYDSAVIAALKSVGVSSNRIQICSYDSGACYDTLVYDLDGNGLSAQHMVNSDKSADWWRDSPGKQSMMRLGDYPCGDGPDMYIQENPPEYLAEGLYWEFITAPASRVASRRASNSQAEYIARTMRNLGFRRYEFLSAAGFQQKSGLPNMDDAILIGRDERQAIANGLL